MSDYQYELGAKRIDSFNPTHQYVERNNRHYPGNTSLIIGYIGTVSEQDVLTRRFNVHIPEFGNERIKAHLVEAMDTISTQGVGSRGFTPEIGTPVVLQYIHGSNQLVIVGGLHLTGANFGETITQDRKFPKPDVPVNYAWHVPTNGTLLEVGIDSSIQVAPYATRSENPLYDVPVANQIPGDVHIVGKQGIDFSTYSNLKAQTAPVVINKSQGLRMAMPDKAIDTLRKEYEQVKEEILKSIDNEYVFENGVITKTRVIRVLKQIRAASLYDLVDDTSTGKLLDTLFGFISRVDNLISSAVRLIDAAQSLIEWFTQDIGLIIDDLLDMFGTFEVGSGGVLGLSVNLSLDNIDVNVALRTGIPFFNNIFNGVVNNILNKLLANFSIGKLLGLGSAGDKLNPKQTFTPNLLTKVVRVKNSLTDLIYSVENIFTDNPIQQLDTPFRQPDILITKGLDLNKPQDQLIKFIFEAGYSNSSQLVDNINSLYTYNSIDSYVLTASHLATSTHQRLFFLFLYGYIIKNDNAVNYYIAQSFPVRLKSKLINRYPWQSLTKEQITDILLTDFNYELTYDFDSIVEPTSLLEFFNNDNLMSDGLEYLLAGQVSDYINQVLINQCSVDIRPNLALYIKLKECVNLTFKLEY